MNSVSLLRNCPASPKTYSVPQAQPDMVSKNPSLSSCLEDQKSWKHLSSPLLFLGTGYSVPCILSGVGKFFSRKHSLLESEKFCCSPHNFKIDFQGWRACEPEKTRQSRNMSVLFFSHKEFIAASKTKNQPSKINTKHLTKLRALVSSFPFPSKPKF